VVTLKHFPEYDAIHPSIRVRITDLPIDDKLRDIRYESFDESCTSKQRLVAAHRE